MSQSCCEESGTGGTTPTSVSLKVIAAISKRSGRPTVTGASELGTDIEGGSTTAGLDALSMTGSESAKAMTAVVSGGERLGAGCAARSGWTGWPDSIGWSWKVSTPSRTTSSGKGSQRRVRPEAPAGAGPSAVVGGVARRPDARGRPFSALRPGERTFRRDRRRLRLWSAGNRVGLLRDRTADHRGGTARSKRPDADTHNHDDHRGQSRRAQQEHRLPSPQGLSCPRFDRRREDRRVRRQVRRVGVFGVRLDAMLGAAAIGTALGPSERNMSSAPDSAGRAVAASARQRWYTPRTISTRSGRSNGTRASANSSSDA